MCEDSGYLCTWEQSFRFTQQDFFMEIYRYHRKSWNLRVATGYRRWHKVAVALLCAGVLVLAYSSLRSSIYGVPPGYTGSPLDGVTCATMGCHRGPVSTVNGWITTNVPATGYVPADTYDITLTASRPNTTIFGFQMATHSLTSVEGSFLVTDPLQTQYSQGTGYITHKIGGTSGTNLKTWQCKWIAPADLQVTEVTLYAAFLTGTFDVDDEVFITHLLLQQGAQKVEEFSDGKNLLWWPNPFYRRLFVHCNDPENPPRSFTLYNLAGIRVYHDTHPQQTTFSTWLLLPGDLPEGMYLLETATANARHLQKVICQRP